MHVPRDGGLDYARGRLKVSPTLRVALGIRLMRGRRAVSAPETAAEHLAVPELEGHSLNGLCSLVR
jgi:hypothetical protein